MTSILKADTIQDADGNNIINESGNTITIGASGDTISIPSGATFNINGTAGTGIGTNSPAFYAYLSSTQSVTNGANTKVQIDTEIFDTDNAFDNSSNYRFTPQTAGKYFVYGAVCGATSVSNRLYQVLAKIYKNGSNTALTSEEFADNVLTRKTSFISTVVDMNGSSDYVELYGFVDIHANNNETIVGSASKMTYFGAHKIIE